MRYHAQRSKDEEQTGDGWIARWITFEIISDNVKVKQELVL